MKKTNRFSIDNSSIVFLAQFCKSHTNTYRFTMTLTEAVCPDTLQQAVDRIYRRFPTVIAGFQRGAFQYYQVPAKEAPKVLPDPGCLLTMSRSELESCAFRIYYRDADISIEAFHALADGYGAIACFTTLVSEYLRLKYGCEIPVKDTLLDPDETPSLPEVEDGYEKYANGTPTRIPGRFAYQLPDHQDHAKIYAHTIRLPVQTLLDAAHAYGVSLNTLLSAVMADAVMELQQQNAHSKKQKPVRIMVPVDLRRLFPSRTLRNFVLYTLPTIEPTEFGLSMTELIQSFDRQIREQAQKEKLASIMAYNVRKQNAWYYRMIPLPLKLKIIWLGCRLFGASNSSITLTNLGSLRLPEEMQPYVRDIFVTLTPRAQSPYNCGILSYNGQLTIQISRFPEVSELERIFEHKLEEYLKGGRA